MRPKAAAALAALSSSVLGLFYLLVHSAPYLGTSCVVLLAGIIHFFAYEKSSLHAAQEVRARGAARLFFPSPHPSSHLALTTPRARLSGRARAAVRESVLDDDGHAVRDRRDVRARLAARARLVVAAARRRRGRDVLVLRQLVRPAPPPAAARALAARVPQLQVDGAARPDLGLHRRPRAHLRRADGARRLLAAEQREQAAQAARGAPARAARDPDAPGAARDRAQLRAQAHEARAALLQGEGPPRRALRHRAARRPRRVARRRALPPPHAARRAARRAARDRPLDPLARARHRRAPADAALGARPRRGLGAQRVRVDEGRRALAAQDDVRPQGRLPEPPQARLPRHQGAFAPARSAR